MSKKMTVVEKFEAISAMLSGNFNGDFTVEQAVEFLGERVAQTKKKNAGGGGEKKLTPEQVANEAIKARIMEVLTTNDAPMTLGELMKQVDGIKSNQHISALVTQLKNAHLVERTEVKGKAHFAPATTSED